MKVELLVSRATAGDPQNRGDVIDVDPAEGKRMIEAGQAVPVRRSAAPEKTVAKPKVEKAAK